MKGCNIFGVKNWQKHPAWCWDALSCNTKKSRQQNAARRTRLMSFRRWSITPSQNSEFAVFSLWYEFFVHYALRVEKSYQRCLDAGTLEFQFLRPRGCLTNPFRTLSLCFGVIGKTPSLISHNNFVKKCCLHWPLRYCLGKIWLGLPFAQVPRIVEQNMQTTFSFPNPLSEPGELQSWGFSKILLSFLMLFEGHFWPVQQQQQCLPQFESILEAHPSHHLLPAPFLLEIENTT